MTLIGACSRLAAKVQFSDRQPPFEKMAAWAKICSTFRVIVVARVDAVVVL